MQPLGVLQTYTTVKAHALNSSSLPIQLNILKGEGFIFT
ncbi:hypothetical protein BDE36_1673 [Arcticibacter tournemirensis]|nr:hypothetical protein BDE36_1673 [Arcticibacter tournemirensis]